jgi:hypothetical protein
MAIAAPVPSSTARRRCSGGSPREASAITTALSPESTRSIPMICSSAIQNAPPVGSSCMGKAVREGGAF